MPNKRLFDANKTRIPKEFQIERLKPSNKTIELIHTAGDKSKFKIVVSANGKMQRSIPIRDQEMGNAIASGQPYIFQLLQSKNEQGLPNELAGIACEPITSIVDSLRTEHCNVTLSVTDEAGRPPNCDFLLSLRMMSDTALPKQMSSFVSNPALANGISTGMRPLMTALALSPAIWNHILNNDPMLISESEKQLILAAIPLLAAVKVKPSKSI